MRVAVLGKLEMGCREPATATGQGFGRRDLVGECQGVSACGVGAPGARAFMPRSAWVRVSAVRYSWFPPVAKAGEAMEATPFHRKSPLKNGRMAPRGFHTVLSK